MVVHQFSSVQSLSHVRLFATPWIAASQASLFITNSQSLLKPMSIESVMPSSHFILCRPLLLLPPVPPSIRVFSNESTLRTRWPKYWSALIPLKTASPNPEGFWEEFYSNGSRAGLLVRNRVCQSLYSFHLASGGLLKSSSSPFSLKWRMLASPICWGYYFPGGSDGKESACNAGDLGSISGSGRSSGGGNGNPLQYSCLGNPMDRRAWQATVHSVTRGHNGVTSTVL